VYPSQIEWYRSTARRLQTEQVRQTEKVPGLAFFHIPVPEFMHVWNYHNTSGRLQDTGIYIFLLYINIYLYIIITHYTNSYCVMRETLTPFLLCCRSVAFL
jgi:hypothetical protein